MVQPRIEFTEKLQKLKELDNQYSELREELQAYLDDVCDGYLAAWLRASLEKGEAFTLSALKESLNRQDYDVENEENITRWHQINEVRKLIAIYELRTHQIQAKTNKKAV